MSTILKFFKKIKPYSKEIKNIFKWGKLYCQFVLLKKLKVHFAAFTFYITYSNYFLKLK